jgi:cobaltochelatase CobT
VGGSQACTDGHHIQIPDVGDDPTSRLLAWGYLAHEAAHVRYTDFALYTAAAREGRLQEMLQNRLEDVRIEQAIARPYPGTRATITAVLERLLRDGLMAAPEPQDHPAAILAGYLLLALRLQVLGQQILATEAQKAEAALRAVFPAVFIQRLQSLMAEVPGLSSTAEAVALARRIGQLIEEAADPAPQAGPSRDGEGPEPAGSEPNEGVCGSHGGGTSKDESTRLSDGTTEREGTEGTETADTAADAGGPSDPSQSSPQRGAGTTGANGPCPADPAQSTAEGGPASADDGTKSLAAVLTAGADELGGDLFATVGKLLGAQGHGTSAMKLPLPEAYAGHALAGMQLLARVQAESARLTARLQGLVQARRGDRPRAVRQGRRVDARKLHRVAVADARLFARRHPRVAPNTAVHLLVDLSGSMAASVTRADGTQVSRSAVALESALALALALAAIPGVTVAVTAFPGLEGTAERVTCMLGDGQSPRAAAGAFIQIPRGGTPMAQALWYGAAELLLRRETRRLLLVLTDGEPDDIDEAARLLRLCRKAAIEPVGVGIGIAVNHLFPTAIEVTTVADLKRALFGVAEALLIGAAA